jgi:hypothetical protein
MMEAARTSETSVDNYFTRQYFPEDKSEIHILSFTSISLKINVTHTNKPPLGARPTVWEPVIVQ